VRGTGEQEAEPAPEQESAADAASDEGASQPPEDADAAGRQGEYLQALQRVTADFANYRRRTAAEQQRWGENAVGGFVLRLLPVVDNLERAVAAAGDAAALRQGVELTLRQLRDVFDAAGIRRMEAVGQPFDPARHEAVAGSAEGVVAEEYRAGYVQQDQVLRPAMVRVGPPEAAAGQDGPAVAAAEAPGEGAGEEGDGRSG
jgi:molecular chaperone GrpE